jgi:hypothetical protein
MTTTNAETSSTNRAIERRADAADGGITTTARQVADNVAGAAGDVTARIPEVAQGTRSALSDANRMIQGGSDQTLQLVGVAVVGFAVGLLVGGANRMLIFLSLVPAAVIGATLLERIEGERPTGSRLQGR